VIARHGRAVGAPVRYERVGSRGAATLAKAGGMTMERGGPVRPRTRPRLLLAAVAALSALAVSGAVASSADAASAARAGSVSDPVAGHPYRHGAVPLRELVPAAAPARTAPPEKAVTTPPPRRARSGGRRALVYAGGPVVAGSPKVYLVFWGSQWGTPGTNGSGYTTFSGDPDGLAPNLQAFVSGLGTNNELWSTIATQYCQGVASGSRACPASGTHVAYPSPGAVLGGVVNDTASPAPNAATAAQIAQQAANAAASLSDPANAQYIVVSPTRTDPDGWLDPNTGYCAYHDNTGDPSLGVVTGPDVPYTNLPYVPDVGGACSSFSSPAVLDGADETFSHEYAETQTDPFPASGWSDAKGNEIGDKCENLAGGSPGGATHIVLATGTFVVQGLWANDLGKSGGCENRHASELITDPGKQTSVVGTPVAVAVAARDVEGLAMSFSASGLPPGLAVNPSTGVISGIPSARGRSHVTVRATDAVSTNSVLFIWTVKR
jgi:hypothetical protein